MASEILDAMLRLDARKEAVLGDRINDGTVGTDMEREMRLVISGLDLNYKELNDAANKAADVFVTVVGNGGEPVHAVGGIFTDALIMGMLIAKARS